MPVVRPGCLRVEVDLAGEAVGDVLRRNAGWRRWRSPSPVTVPAPPVFANVTTVELSLVTVFPVASSIVAVSVCVLPAMVEPLSASVICVAGPWA